ncbi:myomegalin-like isoform X2 [Protopterus annectens]|uniref:myomegalin-like isoform X2 n=1 Tax=Protopterus annectens TaxID=7888 RepID=UPI001CFB57FE|nr:myomegalin-like isoform X2 [Protopterus annectens]
MDSVIGEDPTLPLDFNGSASIPRLPDDAAEGHNDNVTETAPANFAAEGLSPVRARTMKDYENQITDLKKENFNLKLRIYFLEERIQQQFDNSCEEIYRTNIELKVELESLKQDLHEKQKLLIKASKAVESLSGNRDNEIRRVKDEAQRELQKIKDDFSHRINLLEKANKASKEDMEKAFAVTEQEKIRNMGLQKELNAVLKANSSHSAIPPEMNHLLQEKDRLIEHLQQVLHSKDETIEQLKTDQLPEDVKIDGALPDKIQDLTDTLAKKESEVEVLKEKLQYEKTRFEKEVQNLTEKQKCFSNLEMSHKKALEELADTKTILSDIQGKLGEADNNNKTMQMKLKEVQDEFAAEKLKSLKRDKLIQGLSFALKKKEKEVDELCHEIEERDGALAKAREAAHKAQIQRFQGAEEQKSLLMEKETELVKLHAEHNSSLMEIRKLQRFIETKDHELSDLQQAKDQLEKELYEVQQQKNHSDKAVNDLRNQIEKLRCEMEEKRQEMEEHYNTLLSESRQKLQSQEATISRLRDNLNEKEQLLQEYFKMLEESKHEDWNFDGKNALLVKLREFLREKDQALQKAMFEKFCAVEEKEKEIQCLHLAVTEMERELERMKNACSCKEETINRLDGMLKEKDAELSHLMNTCKNFEKVKEQLEESGARLLHEKEEVIAELQKSLSALKKDMEEKVLHVPFVLPVVEDSAHQVWEGLKVKEKLLEQASSEKEHLSSSHKKDMEELLNASRKKDELLKEIETKLCFIIQNCSQETEDLKLRLSEKEQEIAKLQHLYSARQKQDLELAQLKAFLEDKDKIINKLIDRRQEGELIVKRMQEDSHPLELKQTIKILQEFPGDEAEGHQFTYQNAEDGDSSSTRSTDKTLAFMKNELVRRADELNCALQKQNEMKMEIGQLQSVISEQETKLKAQAANIETLSKTLQMKDEIIKDLESENSHYYKETEVKHIFHNTVHSEDHQEPRVSHRVQTAVDDECCNQIKVSSIYETSFLECEDLRRALKEEYKFFVELTKNMQNSESLEHLRSLEQELNSIHLLRKQLEETVRNQKLRREHEKLFQEAKVTKHDVDSSELETLRSQLEEMKKLNASLCDQCDVDNSKLETLKNQLEEMKQWNASLHAQLVGMQTNYSRFGAASETTDSFTLLGDQTSYMSICLDDVDESLDRDIVNLSLRELRKKVAELLLLLKELQTANRELQDKATLAECCLSSEEQREMSFLSTQKELLEKKLEDVVKANETLQEHLCTVSCKNSIQQKKHTSRLPVRRQKDVQTLKKQQQKLKSREGASSCIGESMYSSVALSNGNSSPRLTESPSIVDELLETKKQSGEKEVNQQKMEEELSLIQSILEECGMSSVQELRNDHLRLQNLNADIRCSLEEDFSAENSSCSDREAACEHDTSLKQLIIWVRVKLRKSQKIICLLRKQLELNSSVEGNGGFNPDLIAVTKQIEHLKELLKDATVKADHAETKLRELDACSFKERLENECFKAASVEIESGEQVKSCNISDIAKPMKSACMSGLKSRLPVPVKQFKNPTTLHSFTLTEDTKHVSYHPTSLLNEGAEDTELEIRALLEKLQAAEATVERLQERLQYSAEQGVTATKKCEDREVQVELQDVGFGNIEKREIETVIGNSGSQVMQTTKLENKGAQFDLQDMQFVIVEKKEMGTATEKSSQDYIFPMPQSVITDLKFKDEVHVDLLDLEFEISETAEVRSISENRSNKATKKQEDRNVQVEIQDLGYQKLEDRKVQVDLQDLRFIKHDEREVRVDLQDLRYQKQEEREVQVDLQVLTFEKYEEREVQVDLQDLRDQNQEEKEVQVDLQELTFVKYEEREVQVDLQDLRYQKQEEKEVQVDLQELIFVKYEEREVQVDLQDLRYQKQEEKEVQVDLQELTFVKYEEREVQVDLQDLRYQKQEEKEVQVDLQELTFVKYEEREVQVDLQDLGYEKQESKEVQVDLQKLGFENQDRRDVHVELEGLGHQKREDREVQVDLKYVKFEKQEEREVQVDLQDLRCVKQEDREVQVDLQELGYPKQEGTVVQADLQDLRYKKQDEREVQVNLWDLECTKQENTEFQVAHQDLEYVKQEEREVQVDLWDLGFNKQEAIEVQVDLLHLYEKQEGKEVQVNMQDLGYGKWEERKVQVDQQDFRYKKQEVKEAHIDLQSLQSETIEKRKMEAQKKDRCSQVVPIQKSEDREVQVNLQDLGYEIIEKQKAEAVNEKKSSQATKTLEDKKVQVDLQDFEYEIIEKRDMKPGSEKRSSQVHPKLEDREIQVNVQDLGYELIEKNKMEAVKEEKSSQVYPELEDRDVQVNVQDLGYEIIEKSKMEAVKEEKSNQVESVLQLVDREVQVGLQMPEYEICGLVIPEEDKLRTRQEPLMTHDDKEVQVGLQDLGYETCEKSETEVDRETRGSLDNGSPVLQHHVSDSNILASLKKSGPRFLSMENIDIDSTTSYPSSHSLVSSKISLKTIEAFDDSDLPNDPAQLKEWINELKFQVEKYQKLMQHLKNAIAKKSICDQLSPDYSYCHQTADQICSEELSASASPKEVAVDPSFYSRHSSFCSDTSSRQYEENNLGASVPVLHSGHPESTIKTAFSSALSNDEAAVFKEVNRKLFYSAVDAEKEESSSRILSTSIERSISAGTDAATVDPNFFRRHSSCFSDSSASNDEKCRMNAFLLALQQSDFEGRSKANLSSPSFIHEEEIKKLKHHILDLEADLEKEKTSNTLLTDQLQQLQLRPRTASPIRYDSLVQSQARELSHFREQIKQSRNLCDMHSQQLRDVMKSFEELLQISDVEYYAAEGVREQLDQCVQLAAKLAARLDNDWSSDSDDGEHIKLPQSPRHLKHQVSYLQKQLESERKRMQKHLSDLAQQKQTLSTTFQEQIERLTGELQEKNKAIFQLQLQLRSLSPVSSGSHASLESFLSDKSTHGSLLSNPYQVDNSHLGEHCFLGQYQADVDPNTLLEESTTLTYKTNVGWKRETFVEDMPPQSEMKFCSIQKAASADVIGRNPVPPQVYHVKERKCEAFENVSSALNQSLLNLQKQNSVLQEKLKHSDELNKSLKTELDLHRSILLEKETESTVGAQSIVSGSHHSDSPRTCEAQPALEAQDKSSAVHADLLVEHLKEIRALRQHLEESIRTNEKLHQQLEQRVREAESDPGSTNVFTCGSEQHSHLTSEINFLKEQNQSLKEQTLKMSKARQKESDKLKEALSKKRTTIDHLRNEIESSKRELSRVQKMVIESSEENRQLKNELHYSREEIKQLQHDLNVKIHQLGENQQVLQSLQLELRVYEQMSSSSSKRTVCNEEAFQKCSEEIKSPLDLSELVAEIRNLRIQLELSIQANNALRQKLEEQLQNKAGKADEPGGSTININCLLTRRQRHYVSRNHHGEMCRESDMQDNRGNKGPFTPKCCASPPEKSSLEYQDSSEKKMPARNEETDSTSPCSTYSADCEFGPSTRQVPERQIWVDRNGHHVLGLAEDYSALCKCISEGSGLIHDMESHFRQYLKTISSEGSGLKLTDQGLLKSLSSNFNVMQQVLEEASCLLKLLWRVSLPPSVMQLKQDDKIRKQVIKLHKKLSEQEKILWGTVKQLHASNQLKENMEKIIIEQLTVTHGVLKKARGNLEMQPSENTDADGKCENTDADGK